MTSLRLGKKKKRFLLHFSRFRNFALVIVKLIIQTNQPTENMLIEKNNCIIERTDDDIGGVGRQHTEEVSLTTDQQGLVVSNNNLLNIFVTIRMKIWITHMVICLYLWE